MDDTVTVASDEEYEHITRPVNFKMFSGLLKAYEAEDGTKVIRGIASSTIADRNGDSIERTAIDDMVASANDNMTIFLNHSYNVPEDVAGSVRAATANQAGQSPEGPIWDMAYDVTVNEANPRALETFEAIKRGTKLGLSIGARIPEGGAVRNKSTGSYRFQHLELLETSIVGLPANPRSWISSVVKALKVDEEQPVMRTEINLDSGNVVQTITTGSIETKSDKDDVFTSEDMPTSEPEVHTTAPDPPAKGEEESSQGAPGSEPEDEQAPEEVTKSSVGMAALNETLTMVSSLTQELITTRTERDAAYRARDEAFETTDQIVREAALIVEKLASIPLGRKAAFREAQDILSGLERIYGASLLQRMRGTNGS